MRQPNDEGTPAPIPRGLLRDECRRITGARWRHSSRHAARAGSFAVARVLRTVLRRARRSCLLFAPRNGMLALKRLRGRVARAGLGWGRGVTAATVVAGRRRAASQAAVLPDPRLRHLPGTQGHLDEMGTFLARQPARETDEAGARGPHGADGRQWVGGRGASALRLMSAAVGGPRPRQTAKEVVAAPQARGVGRARASGGVPASPAVRSRRLWALGR